MVGGKETTSGTGTGDKILVTLLKGAGATPEAQAAALRVYAEHLTHRTDHDEPGARGDTDKSKETVKGAPTR